MKIIITYQFNKVVQGEGGTFSRGKTSLTTAIGYTYAEVKTLSQESIDAVLAKIKQAEGATIVVPLFIAAIKSLKTIKE